MNIFHAEWIYSLLFGLLLMTSIFFHTMPTLFTNLADKVCIVLIILYGAYQLYIKTIPEKYGNVVPIVLSFLACIGLYIYGYFTAHYCYDPDLGNWYHALLHLISSVGHHAILLL